MASSSAQKHGKSLSTQSDLWVLPDSEHSRWFARIDWYLNWQMSKGLAHNRPEPSTELMELLLSNGMEFAQPENFDHSPLMVAANGRLPANQCVVIEYKKGQHLRTWIEKIEELSKNLNSKSVRVFLPDEFSAKDASAHWSTSKIEVQFTTDEDTAT